MIRPVTENDAKELCEIYNHYIENSNISFEEELLSIDDMRDRISLNASQYPWLVYETEGKVMAYAYASTWKSRAAYRFTLESTIYTAPDLNQKGIGTRLYEKLFEELEGCLVRSVMGVIALPNDASVGLHEKMGFTKVAHFKEVGYKHDEWLDVGYWQKFL